MNDGDRLQLQDAGFEIRTLEITVKALRLSNKQMTLTFFRQIPHRPLIDKDVPKLLHRPFAWVNYDTPNRFVRNYLFLSDGKLHCCNVEIRTSDEEISSTRRGSYPNPPVPKEWCDRWDAIMEQLLPVEQMFIGV